MIHYANTKNGKKVFKILVPHNTFKDIMVTKGFKVEGKDDIIYETFTQLCKEEGIVYRV